MVFDFENNSLGAKDDFINMLRQGGRNLLNYGKEVFTDVSGDKEVKTTAIVFAVKSLIGSEPIVDRSNPGVNVIKFTKVQRLKLENYVNKDTTKKDSSGRTVPSNVKVEHTSLWLPYALKKALPYGLGLAGLAFVLGRLSK